MRPEGVCPFAQSFFGAEIQPKHLVFCYLGFLPGFSLAFCFLPHPIHSLFFKKTKLSCFGGFGFFGFLNPNNCLVSWSC
jgi:hypothetical protein